MTRATTIVSARVFDGVALREWTSVRFADGVITGCAEVPLTQDGDLVVDASGGTVIPGLIDTHVHLIPGALQTSLNAGVTTVIDLFSLPETVAAARRQLAAGLPGVGFAGADLRSAGIGATAPGGHPSLVYGEFPTLSAPAEAEDFVAARIAEGSDLLKIFSGVGSLWPSLDLATIEALVSAAHAAGLPVVAHVSSVAGVEEVVAAGVDLIAHVPADAALAPALIARIADAGIAVGPTLAALEATFGGAGAGARPAGGGEPTGGGAAGGAGGRAGSGGTAVSGPFVAGASIGGVESAVGRLGGGGAGGGRGGASGVGRTRAGFRPAYAVAEENVRRLAAAGVTVLAGTDAPNPGVGFGTGLHRELAFLERAGLSAAAALAAATSAPARVFGLADRGLIGEGLRADLVLVPGDPLADIAALGGVDRVWKQGEQVDRRPFVPTAAESEALAAFDAGVARAVAAVRARRRPGPPR